MTAVSHSSFRIYAMEALLLGLFMVSACSFGALLEHPSSPVRRAIQDGFVRRSLMGVAMGATAVALIYSYPGRRTGAHMNPAVTLSALRLGRIKPHDAAGYIIAQFIGAVLGVAFMFLIARPWVGHPCINYVATLPGASVSVPELSDKIVPMVLVRDPDGHVLQVEETKSLPSKLNGQPASPKQSLCPFTPYPEPHPL